MHLQSHTARSPVALIGALFAALAMMFAVGLTSAPVASAHTLSPDSAARAANNFGARKVASAGNDYVAFKVISCKRLFPHQFRCRIGYDTPSTRTTNYYACTEYVVPHYKAHNTGLRGVYVDLAGGQHGC